LVVIRSGAFICVVFLSHFRFIFSCVAFLGIAVQ
jgi:hypothetical protein